jgi:hypothetical protein
MIMPDTKDRDKITEIKTIYLLFINPHLFISFKFIKMIITLAQQR